MLFRSVAAALAPHTGNAQVMGVTGPPGVGKSTLAQRYVADHPGSLNLDIDTVASLIGGWRQDFFGVLPGARNIAVAMAETHLRSGADVVLPQLLMIVDEVRRFELAAERAGFTGGWLEEGAESAEIGRASCRERVSDTV